MNVYFFRIIQFQCKVFALGRPGQLASQMANGTGVIGRGIHNTFTDDESVVYMYRARAQQIPEVYIAQSIAIATSNYRPLQCNKLSVSDYHMLMNSKVK